MINDKQLAYLLRNGDKLRAELNLMDFIRQAWSQIEPGVTFVDGWAVQAVAEHLQAVTEGQIKKLLINIPPGCSKSMFTCVMWPAWEWGPRGLSHHRFISGSYDQGLATRDLLRCRDLIQSEWYQARWPLQLKADQNEKTYYENTMTGWRKSVGVRGALTGYRGDRVVIDDPHDVKGAESEATRNEGCRWFFETVPTRFNNQDTFAMVIIMQRLHEQDISGRILDDEELASEWTQLILPMRHEVERHCSTSVVLSTTGETFKDPRTEEGELLWTDRFSEETVSTMEKTFRAESGDYAVAGQLQQRPVPRGGGEFKRADFIVITTPPTEPGIIVRAWDLAGSKEKRSAYTAGVKLHIGTKSRRLTILDMVRFKGTSSEVDIEMLRVARLDGKSITIDIPQDPGSAGKTAVSHITANLEGFTVRSSPESGDKEFRAGPFASQVQAGNVFVLNRPWTEPLLREAEMFPGKFKDQIDALSRAYAALLRARKSDLPIIPPTLSVKKG